MADPVVMAVGTARILVARPPSRFKSRVKPLPGKNINFKYVGPKARR